MRIKLTGWFCLLYCFMFVHVHASHIVGADVYYTCMGSAGSNANNYRISIILYQDCLTGSPQAIAEDNPAFVAIYDAVTNQLVLMDSINGNSVQIVPPNFSNECINNPPTTCLRKQSFQKIYTLQNNANGYRIVYQRCCRNGSILNIASPDAVGATYTCLIPPYSPSVNCNNSAIFKNYPPQIVCVNNPLVYDHSATDADGDSLSYGFCEAYTGGSQNDAKPFPAPPPYQPVTYIGAFSDQNPMGGNPIVSIDPVTGLITGTPNISGRYVVAVCCYEWRNGVNINTVKREFQFVVTNCSKAVVADMPQYSDEPQTYIVQCRDFTVTFDNLSTGGFSYFWDFGVPALLDDTSDQFSPTYTYPDTGTYAVKLIVNKGSTCEDSIIKLVKVYPTFTGHFTYDGQPCPNSPFMFKDSSYGTVNTVNFWLWNFGDGSTSNIKEPVHTYTQGGTYDVVLVSKNTRGCSDTVTQQVYVEDFDPFAGNDTIIVKGESINFNARGGGQYTWTPATNLSNPNIGDPVGYYPDTGRFTYYVHIVSPSQCVGDDTLSVWVVNQSSIFVPTGFTPNRDGRNDVLKPIGIGYHNINFFRVYNRWGEQVFYTTKFDEGWDGTLHGTPADMGTYFWVLSINNRFGKEELIKGDAQLIR